MDAGVIIAIVIAALILIALLMVLGKKGRERRQESKRIEAGEIRREAQVSGAQAERSRAESEERAARARREQAVAREQAARAEKEARSARERQERADKIDPDAGDSGRGRRRRRLFKRGGDDSGETKREQVEYVDGKETEHHVERERR